MVVVGFILYSEYFVVVWLEETHFACKQKLYKYCHSISVKKHNFLKLLVDDSRNLYCYEKLLLNWRQGFACDFTGGNKEVKITDFESVLIESPFHSVKSVALPQYFPQQLLLIFINSEHVFKISSSPEIVQLEHSIAVPIIINLLSS